MMKVGIFDHISRFLGGGQLVVGWMAALLSREFEVELIHSGKGYTVVSLGNAFGIDLSQVGERILDNSLGSFALPWGKSLPWLLSRRVYADHKLTKPYDLFIFSGHGIPPFCFSRKGMVYCHFPAETSPMFSIRNSEGWKRKSSLQRRLRLPLIRGLWEWRMRKYQTILANSNFTASWIDRRWERSSSVVYPPVSLALPRVEKRNQIVSLGRFVGKDRKNHIDQIRAFSDFLSRSGSEWSLTLIGFGSELAEDQEYLSQLRAQARDLPVKFIVNAERHEVLEVLAEAKLYWHTAGIGVDPQIDPYRLEHFGISTVEAMRAGCVPIVSAYGGQAEIVKQGVSGFLSRDLAEFVRYNVTLATDENLLGKMSLAASERSKSFLPLVFEQRFLDFVSKQKI